MRRLTFVVCALVAVLFVSGAAPGAGSKSKVKLDMYRATVSQAQYRALLAKGTDIAAAKRVANGVRLDLVLTPQQASALTTKGVKATLIRNKKGQTVRQMAAAQGRSDRVLQGHDTQTDERPATERSSFSSRHGDPSFAIES